MDVVALLLADQEGVVARRQALAAGLSATDVNRLVRRREWVAVHRGVYVAHNGPLSWRERAWAAVLVAWPAALSHGSALRATDGPGRRERDDSIVHVAVERYRKVVAPGGVRVHRVPRFEDRVLWNVGPPRMRYDDAVLDCAAAAPTDLSAIGVLANACGGRRTTANRLAGTLAARPWQVRRELLRDVLHDVSTGVCSVLEHGYLDRVERPHGLPVGRRQAPVAGGARRMFSDVLYEEQESIVELDGRLFHDSVLARDRDLDRDLQAAADGRRTVRLGYGQVMERPCATAVGIAAVLRRGGWNGELKPCAKCGGSVQAG